MSAVNEQDRAPIVTQEDLNLIMTKEKGKFIITMSGRLVSINGQTIFNNQELDFQYQNLVTGLRDVINAPQSADEYAEAVEGLESINIFPFRMH